MNKFYFNCKDCKAELEYTILPDDAKDPQKRCEFCWMWSKSYKSEKIKDGEVSC